MAAPERIGPSEVHERIGSGVGTLLVCAYESDEKFKNARLEGAISLSEFRARESSLPRDQEVVFYCA